MIGVNIQTSQSGYFSWTADSKLSPLFKIVLNVDNDASFFPMQIIKWLVFLHKTGTIWWFMWSTVDPEKCLPLTLPLFQHKFSSIILLIIESVIISMVPLDHYLLFLMWFLPLLFDTVFKVVLDYWLGFV